MILKLQLPLAWSESANPEVLAYNQWRTKQAFLPLSADLVQLFAGRERIFVQGQFDAENRLTIESIVPDRGW